MRPNEIAVEDLPSPGNEDVTNTRLAVVPNPRLVKPTLRKAALRSPATAAVRGFRALGRCAASRSAE